MAAAPPPLSRSGSSILESYTTFLKQETDASSATAAIMALTDDIRRPNATTRMGLRDGLRQASRGMLRQTLTRTRA